jgi:aldose 1-epimerase
MSESNFSAQKLEVDGIEIVRLTDAAHNIRVSVAPSLGNNSYEMTVNGQPVFWSPYSSPSELKSKPTFLGAPFLAPWANRLDRDGFFANGKSYALNPALKNYRYDSNHHPIHGLLSYSNLWQVVRSGADDNSAWVTSRLEFWRYPDLMAQFPFAHVIEMTYRLRDGALEVETSIENLSNEPMPLAIGYHPYFRLSDTHRDTWQVHLAARDHVLLSDALIPTGELKPVDLPDPVSLANRQLDDVFTNLIRGADGRAEFWVESGGKRISVIYGPKYKVAVVFAPPGRDFICFEPMTAVTNAFNLAHDGKYDELESIAPRATWRESFWIKTHGYRRP